MKQIMSAAFGAGAVILGFGILTSHAGAAQPTQITISGKKFSLPTLNQKLNEATVEVEDPVYKTKKTYEGFWLKDVLKLAGVTIKATDELILRCADGYSPTLAADQLNEGEALLAFRDTKAKSGWEPIQQGKEKLTPAPFYLVWKSGDPALPWPYQLVGIEVVDLATKFSRIYPKALDPEYFQDSRSTQKKMILQGFDHFKKKCLKCHSLNLQGGTLGPELNSPKNITEYWDESVLPEFISNPAEFRARSKMPAFPELTERDLDALLRYFKFMKKHKSESDH